MPCRSALRRLHTERASRRRSALFVFAPLIIIDACAHGLVSCVVMMMNLKRFG